MYVHIPRKYKCSKCGSIDEYIVYWKNADQFRKCEKCGHKVIEATMTRTDNGGIIYNMDNSDEPITF